MKVLLVFLAFAVVPLRPSIAQSIPCADVALVLAIDGSGSISDIEFFFQLDATGQALRDPAVVGRMQSVGGVAVAAVLWGDAATGTQVIGWEKVADAGGAERFARRLTSQKRIVTGNTDIGVGLMAALDLLDDPRNCAMRRVIDVSGDGRETPLFRKGEKISLLQSVSRAKEMGVVINGLAITTKDPDLEEYFRTRVITGIGSFVDPVASYSDFADAMKRKLLRELVMPDLALNLTPPTDLPLRAPD